MPGNVSLSRQLIRCRPSRIDDLDHVFEINLVLALTLNAAIVQSGRLQQRLHHNDPPFSLLLLCERSSHPASPDAASSITDFLIV